MNFNYEILYCTSNNLTENSLLMKYILFNNLPKKGREIIIAIVLFVTIPGSITAQMAGNKVCDSIKFKIIESAKKDATINEGSQANIVSEIYSKNSCYTREEILGLYKTAYDNAKLGKTKTIKDIIPQVGGVFVILLLVILAFKEFLRKQLVELFNYFSKLVYKKFQGHALFYRRSLKKYKRALIKKHEYIPILFRLDKPLRMSETYIPLRSYRGGISKQEIDCLNAVREYQKVMVVGIPGSGKSLFCESILYDFGRGKYPHIAVRVMLSRLNDREKTMLPAIIEELGRNDFRCGENFIEQNLRNNNFLLLFDGFDEVAENERTRVALLLKDFISLYKCSRYVITCRNAVYKDVFESVTNSTLEIIGFNNYQIRLFLKGWMSEMPPGKSINHLISALQERPPLMVLATNPLMLSIIAYTYTKTDYILPNSRADFYHEATDILLNRWNNTSNSYEVFEKKPVLKALALINQDEVNKLRSDGYVLRYERVMEEMKRILPSFDASTHKAVLKEIVERSGLLISLDYGQIYRFAHLTFQEYFSAEALRSDESGLLERFEKDNSNWRETVKLWCGLVKDATSLIAKIYEIDKMLAFECLSEASYIEPKFAEHIIDYFAKESSLSGIEKDRVARVFGSLADFKFKDRSIFDDLEMRLSESNDKDEISYVITTLSYTYLSKGAFVLADYYGIHAEVHAALVRMGDIAIPAIVETVKKGKVNALSCLNKINTPDAALNLVSFIWKNTQEAYVACYFLSEMLSQPNIEEVLRKCTLSQDEKTSDHFSWVWEPFKEPVDSPLRIITGRMVYLLAKTEFVNPANFTYLKLDPRILFPLSISTDWSMTAKHFKSILKMYPSIVSVLENDNYYIRDFQIRYEYPERKRIESFFPDDDKNDKGGFSINDIIFTCIRIYKHHINEGRVKKSEFWAFITDLYQNKKVANNILKPLPSEAGMKLFFVFLLEPPSIDNWVNIFKQKTYFFKRSLHRSLMIFITLLLSSFAAWVIMGTIIKSAFSVTIFIGISAAIVLLTLLILRGLKLYPLETGSYSFTSAAREFKERLILVYIWGGIVLYPIYLFLKMEYHSHLIAVLPLIIIILFAFLSYRSSALERKGNNLIGRLMIEEEVFKISFPNSHSLFSK